MIKPLEEWSQGQLRMEVASLADAPFYLVMTDFEKKGNRLPVSRDEMIAYIEDKRK